MKKPEPPPIDDLNLLDRILELLQNKDLNELLLKIEREYPYWETFKYKVKDNHIDAKRLWQYNKLLRNRTISAIIINNLAGFKFKYNSTSKILKYLHTFDLNLGGILEGSSIIPAEEKTRYLISSIMEEAIASSQLEGAATTREIAKEMLRTNRKPRTISEKMILNNYWTIKKVLEIKNEPMTKELILNLHSIITKDTLDTSSMEGKFRTNNDVKIVDNITGEVFYDPPGYENIDDLINSFCEFANSKNEDEFIHPISRGIILHFLIGYIHPFVDGNGRTARAIFYWYLISKNYWLIEYMSISRIIVKSPAKYARAYLYSEYDDNDLTYFIEYNLRAMDLALKSLKKYISRKINEKQSLYALIRNENINERQAEILKSLIVDNQRRLTIREIQSKFGIVYQTARTDLLGLESLGYLKGKKFGKKLVFFRVADWEEKVKKISATPFEELRN